MKPLESLVILPLIFTGCANAGYNPEVKNVEIKYEFEYSVLFVRPVVKDGYGAKVIYEF